MVILIYGDQPLSIKNHYKKLASDFLENDVNDFNFTIYDGARSLVQDVVEDAYLSPLGSDKKVIVLDNAYFLKKIKPKQNIESEQNYDVLSCYINEQNPSTLLILTLYSEDVDNKSNLFKLISQNGKVVFFKKEDDKNWFKYCESRFQKENVKIDRDALLEVTERTKGDTYLLINTINKLVLYKDHIRLNDVDLLVSRTFEDKIYFLFNHLLNDNIGDALSLFYDLKLNKVQPISLISYLGNSFRLLYEILYLFKKGHSKEEIAEILSLKVARVSLLAKHFSKFPEQRIANILKSLHELDYKIKSGQFTDHFLAFELFLLTFH